MNDVAINILQAVVAHAPNEEPGANVGVLLSCEWGLSLAATIDVECCEVARELAPILGNEAPLWELFLFGPFHVQTAYFVASKLIPEHVVRQIEHQMVRL